MSLPISKLHQQILWSLKRFQKAESELLKLLNELDTRKGYLDLGYASLFEYCTESLKLSESQASAFIAVGRKAREFPKLMKAIQSGELSVSKAKRITRVVHFGDPSEWIQKAETYTQKEMELEVARLAPQVFSSERRERLSEKIYRVTLAMTAETVEKFETAQDLLETSNFETTLMEVLSFFLEKKDPLLKAKRAEERSQKKTGESKIEQEQKERRVKDKGNKKFPEETKDQENNLEREDLSSDPAFDPIAREQQLLREFSKNRSPNQDGMVSIQHSLRNVKTGFFYFKPVPFRLPIPKALDHQVQLRDNGHCQYRLPNGKLCASRRYLHLHHRTPVSQNGKNTLENLVLVCSRHHRLHHFLEEKNVSSAHTKTPGL